MENAVLFSDKPQSIKSKANTF